MSRYIDTDALSEYVEKQYMGFIGNPTWDDINSAPSIDIVRCKECAKRMKEDCPMCNGCKLDRVPTEDDDFCSYGEREGE